MTHPVVSTLITVVLCLLFQSFCPLSVNHSSGLESECLQFDHGSIYNVGMARSYMDMQIELELALAFIRTFIQPLLSLTVSHDHHDLC